MENLAQELVSKINTERKLYTFIERVAKNREVAAKLPNTHSFFQSLNNGRATYGKLTDNQKVAANKTIRKYAPQFVELMKYSAPSVNTQTDEQIERTAIQDEVRGSDENAPITMQPE